MKYFKVKTGYGKDDFISVDEDEAKIAIKAQINNQVAIFQQGSISGSLILSVLPDFNRLLGLNRDYQLTGEDYALIPKKTSDEYYVFLQNVKLGVTGATRPEFPTGFLPQVKVLGESKTVE